MFDKLFAAIAPHECLQCGAEGSLWCASCRGSSMPAIERCYRCHGLMPLGRTCRACRSSSALYGVRAAVRYEGAAKELVWKLKFEGAQAAANIVTDMLADLVVVSEVTCIVHVPTASRRVRTRGYDQARLIARGLSSRTEVPLLPCLVRIGQQQQRSASRAQRLSQLQDAFRLAASHEVRGENILLVDDVITTGATLEAAAVTLKRAGAWRVSALVFAQA